jgi:hypothetical protein
MRSLTIKLGIILIGLVIFSYAEVWGADWKLLITLETEVYYYNPETLTNSSRNVLRVWLKAVFSKKGITEMVGTFGKRYENLSYGLLLNEVDCGERKSRFLSLLLYSEDGSVLGSEDSPDKFADIVPGSADSYLYKEVRK